MDLATQTRAEDRFGSDEALDLAALVGAEGWSRLPAAVQRRFAAAHADTVYHGTLDLHCSSLGRCFVALGALLGGPLTDLRAGGVPAEVRVYGNGRGGVVWERRLQAGSRAGLCIVRSTKELGPHNRLVERTDSGLGMDLDVFEDERALVFRSRRYFFALGGLRVPVPAWLAPGTCRVEHRDLGTGNFRFTLSMVHPWWGRTFHQTGVFTDPKEDLE